MKNDFILAARNIKRYPLIFSVNIIGLTVAFIFVIFGVRFVYTGTGADNFHLNRADIYRIERTDGRCWTPNILHSWLKSNIPEIIHVTRVLNDGGIGRDRYLSKGDRNFLIERPLVADSDFLEIFTFPAEVGDLSSFGSEKHSIIITKPVAEKIYGEENPVGETILYNNTPYTIKAVLKKIPANSSLQFDLLIPAPNIPDYAIDQNWRNNTMQTFILAGPGIEQENLQQKIRDNVASVFKESGIEEELSKWQYSLNPLDRIYFSEYSNRNADNICIHGNKKHYFLVSSLVFIVLIIVLINFINTYLARASDNRKTLAVRSISGATRCDNVRFIEFECLIPFLVAMVAALVISIDLDKIVNPLLGNQAAGIDFKQFACIMVTGILSGLITGTYPAFYLTSLKNRDSLRAKNKVKPGMISIRNFLIIFQFTVTIAMIVVLLVMQKQLRYILVESNRNFDPGTVVYLPLSSRGQVKSQQTLALQTALRAVPEVEKVSTCLHLPGDETYSGLGIVLKNNDSEEEIMVDHNCVDYGYPEVLGYQLVQGRTFDPEIISDKGSYMVNESFVKRYRIDDLSKVILNNNPVIGVIKDFHFNSLHNQIEPLAIQYIDNYQSRIILKLNKAGVLSPSVALKKIQEVIDGTDIRGVAGIEFLEDHISSQYAEEERLKDLILYLSFISIIISCLGLFAMSLLLARSRTKEIGIRKVNGAKAGEIISMLNKDLTRWVLIAFPGACLLSWLILKKWIHNFEYRTEISFWIFLLAGLMAITIAVLTVSWQSWRAATRNPVEALRYE